jgi:hypothetical protein
MIQRKKELFLMMLSDNKEDLELLEVKLSISHAKMQLILASSIPK